VLTVDEFTTIVEAHSTGSRSALVGLDLRDVFSDDLL
jgi:hypothetical protein